MEWKIVLSRFLPKSTNLHSRDLYCLTRTRTRARKHVRVRLQKSTRAVCPTSHLPRVSLTRTALTPSFFWREPSKFDFAWSSALSWALEGDIWLIMALRRTKWHSINISYQDFKLLIHCRGLKSKLKKY